MNEDCDCGCNDPVATNPKEMLEFLANRFEYAGVADSVAKYYARDIRKILKEYFGKQNVKHIKRRLNMNEQIKEIAQKAGIGILYDYSEPDDPDGFSTHAGVCDLKDINKFAELIIQEICTLIKPDEEWRRDASWGYIGGEEGVELLDGAISTIKGHFGVKS